jgi:hypothetical protein
MTEPPLDLRASAAVLRRGWMVILAIALAGLIAGIGYGLRGGSQSSALALVLVPQQFTNGAPVDNMTTQMVIAMSDPVVTPAGKSVTPPVSIGQLKVRVTSPAGTNILRIEVRAPQRQQAVQMANGVAKGYIQYVVDNHQISGQPIVLQQAAPASTSSPLKKSAPIGLVAGLLAGCIVVFVRGRRDRRLRRRDEIADAVGLPVLAAIEAGQYRTFTEWTQFLENFEPSPTELWNMRRVLNLVLRDQDAEPTIRLVSYADDSAALAAGPQLALAAAELGVEVRLEPGMHEVLAPLRAACAQLKRYGYVDRSYTLPIHEDDSWMRTWDRRNQAPISADFVVSILALDRSYPDWSAFAGQSILAISSGAAVADELARLALAAAEGGGRIEGILLVNPEPGDSGAGLAPDRQEAQTSAHVANDFPGDGASIVGQPT